MRGLACDTGMCCGWLRQYVVSKIPLSYFTSNKRKLVYKKRCLLVISKIWLLINTVYQNDILSCQPMASRTFCVSEHIQGTGFYYGAQPECLVSLAETVRRKLVLLYVLASAWCQYAARHKDGDSGNVHGGSLFSSPLRFTIHP